MRNPEMQHNRKQCHLKKKKKKKIIILTVKWKDSKFKIRDADFHVRWWTTQHKDALKKHLSAFKPAVKF